MCNGYYSNAHFFSTMYTHNSALQVLARFLAHEPPHGKAACTVERVELFEIVYVHKHKQPDNLSVIKLIGSFIDIGSAARGGITALKDVSAAAGLGFESLASAIDISATALGAFLGVAAGIAAIGIGIHLYNKHLENLRQEADDASESFRNAQTEISDYSERIKELKNQLENDELTNEESYNIRKELLEIQDTLIENYGLEAGALDVLGESAAETNQRLQELTRTEALRALENGKKGYEEATYRMNTAEAINLDQLRHNRLSEVKQSLAEIVDEIDNVTINGNFLHFSGDKYAQQQALQELQDAMLAANESVAGYGSGAWNSLLKEITSKLHSVEDTIDEFGSRYQDYIWNKIFADETGKSADYMNRITGYTQKIQEAIANQDWTALNFNDIMLQGMRNSLMYDTSLPEDVRTYLIGLIDDAIAGISPYETVLQVKVHLETTPGAKDQAIEALEAFMDDGVLDEGLIGNMLLGQAEGSYEQWSGLAKLATVAVESGTNVMGLIEILKQLGYVSSSTSSAIADEADAVTQTYKSYDQLKEKVEAVAQVHNLLGTSIANGQALNDDLYSSIVTLVGGEEALSDCIDKENGNLVTNAERLLEVIDAAEGAAKAELELAESHEMLKHHELVKILDQLVGQLDETADAEDGYSDAIMETIGVVTSQISATRSQIEQYKLLEQQLLGTTNAFDRLENAQNIDSASDYTDDLSGAIEGIIQAYENHEFGTEYFQEAFQDLIPESAYDGIYDAADRLDAGWDYLQTVLSKYYDYDNGKVSIGFDQVQQFVQDGLGSVFDGTLDDFTLSPQIHSLQEFADAMGVTETVAFAMANAISKYTIGNDNFLIDLAIAGGDTETALYACEQKLADLEEAKAELLAGDHNADGFEETLAELNAQIDEMRGKLTGLSEENFNNVVTSITIDTDLEQAQHDVDYWQHEVENADTEIELRTAWEGYEEAQARLAELQEQKDHLEEPGELALEASLEYVRGEIETTKAQLDELATYDDETLTWTATVDADQEQVDELVSRLDELETSEHTITEYLGVDDEDANDALQMIAEFTIDDKDFAVEADTTRAKSALSDIIKMLATIKDKSVTVTITQQTSTGSTSKSGSKRGAGGAYGNARAFGTAHTGGVWGTPRAEKNALVGELGQELYVNPETGVWRTVGDNGAELISLPKGAIIFNHKQTEGLLKNRRIDSRGRAFAFGNAHYNMSGKYQYGVNSSGSSSSSKSSYSSTASSVSATSTADEAEELDWISVLLERIDRQVKQLDDDYNSAFGSINRRLTTSADLVSELTTQYDAAQGAAEAYWHAADSVNISDYYKNLAKNGAIQLDSITDDDLKKKIQQYQDYISKAQDAEDQAREALTQIAQVYVDNFDLVSKRFEYELQELEDAQKYIESQIELTEALGQTVSSSYYEQLIAYEQQKSEALTDELEELQAKMDEALASGAIEEGSEEWYEMQAQIRGVRQELLDSAIAAQEYKNALNDLFDSVLRNYDNALSGIDHAQSMLEKELEMWEYMAHRDAGEITADLIYNEQARATVLQEELDAANAELAKRLADGTINMYDSDYYDSMETIWKLEEELLDTSNRINQYERDAFSRIQNGFSQQLGQIQHRANLLQTQISTVETRGYVAGQRFYEALIRNENEQIATMENERDAMQENLDLMLATGQVQIGSSQWYELQAAIDAVTESIESGRQALAEYTKQLRTLRWEQFNYTLDLIGDLNSEADFLIKLLQYNNDSVKTWDRAFRDANGDIESMDLSSIGSLTGEGLAVMGLYAQQYMTYMDMASRYADERANIEKQLAEDPYNKDLLERRRELIRLEQESILNQYAERDAIKSLVQDGINAELTALKNLISYYKESLDSAKD